MMFNCAKFCSRFRISIARYWDDQIGLKAAMPSFYGVVGSRKALGSLFVRIQNWYGKQWISNNNQ